MNAEVSASDGSPDPLRVGIIGCGIVSEAYKRTHGLDPRIEGTTGGGRVSRRHPGDPVKDDLVRSYLPPPFFDRVPRRDRAWRGRTILMLWGLGYPLEMAWSLGMAEDDEQVATYRDAVSLLDDRHLIELLDATVASRMDNTWHSCRSG